VAGGSRFDDLRKLLLARASLVPGHSGGTTCARLCAGSIDGVPGMLVDRFGPLLVAVDYGEPDGHGGSAEALLGLVRGCLPEQYAVVKVRLSADGSNRFSTASFGPAPLDAGLVASECGLKFEIRTDPVHDFGLFLDAAKARAFVRAVARGKRVLNLFSYAGAFGIAAAVGGAAAVTNVDPNRDYLTWSLRNAELNQVSMRVLPDTAQAYLAKHRRRLVRAPEHASYDLVIIDPPAFGVGRGNQRVLRLLWPELFDSLRTMKPAQVILMCNDKSFQSRRSFTDLVRDELGTCYRFKRLGTAWTMADLASETPALGWVPGIEDPFYSEPVVLAGTRADLSDS
jgi:23S rRNA (cytosine1962-C5)-methyltransferase